MSFWGGRVSYIKNGGVEATYTAVIGFDGKPLRFVFDKQRLILPTISGRYGFRAIGGKPVDPVAALRVGDHPGAGFRALHASCPMG